MMRHVREYLAVGGMLATVRAFAPERDFGAARDVQLNLHALYLDDIAQYAPPEERVKARACLERTVVYGGAKGEVVELPIGRVRLTNATLLWQLRIEVFLVREEIVCRYD